MPAAQDSKLVEEILQLKEDRRAIILAHNYQRPEIQDIADFLGDSLELSQKATQTDAEVIVFCGVRFMAETASILCPNKMVLFPDPNAGCSLADMITADSLRQKKREHPEAIVICYVNSSAEVKAESDICCTSANAARVVSRLSAEDGILFVPDQYLGHFVSQSTGQQLILWPGFCPTHVGIRPEDILRMRKEHPEARVIVHPECQPEVIELADEALSTGGMVRFAQRTAAQEIVVGTEVGIIHRLKKENPEREFFPAQERAICPDMKLITLEKVLFSLREMSPEVRVPEEIRLRAKAAVDKMLQVA